MILLVGWSATEPVTSGTSAIETVLDLEAA